MRHAVAALVGILLAAIPALAATATFDPPLIAVPAGTPASFEVTVALDCLPGFNWAQVTIGSDEVTDIQFEYSADWTNAFAQVPTPAYDGGIYLQDVLVGGENPAWVGPSLLLGTVSVDTTGMAPGAYSIGIDHAIDGASALALDSVDETLNGFATIIIPEPSTLPLLGLLVWIAIARRTAVSRPG